MKGDLQMNRDDIIKIVGLVEKEFENNYKKYEVQGYSLAEINTIPFFNQTLSSRVVSNWGTDEDEDFTICYSENGWEDFNITTQVGAGVQEIVNQHTSKTSKESIAKYFETMSLFDQKRFLDKAFDIIADSDYKYEVMK